MAACPVRRRSNMAAVVPQTKEEWLEAVAKLSGSHPLESLAAQVLQKFDFATPQVSRSTFSTAPTPREGGRWDPPG
jgi:hypothetical protein